MKAIVYESNTGYTAEYARLLGEKTGLPVYTVAEAKTTLKAADEIAYCSWLMAGSIVGYRKAAKCFSIKAVCAVGLCETGSLLAETRSVNKLVEGISLFTLQGGYAPQKLHGIYKWMMKLVTKVLIKKIDQKETRTDADLQMRQVLTNGGSYVCVENLAEVVAYLDGEKTI